MDSTTAAMDVSAPPLPHDVIVRVLYFAADSLLTLSRISQLDSITRHLTWDSPSFKASILARAHTPKSIVQNPGSNLKFLAQPDGALLLESLIKRGAVTKEAWPSAAGYVIKRFPMDTAHLRVLLANGFMVNPNILYDAAQNGQTEVVRLVLRRKDAILVRPIPGKLIHSALVIAAAEGGHAGLVDVLIDEFALEVDQRDMEGRTPLQKACLNGHEDLVKHLVERGADMEAKDRYGNVPIQNCFQADKPSIITLLLRLGARPTGLVEFRRRARSTPRTSVPMPAQYAPRWDLVQSPLLSAACSAGYAGVVAALLAAWGGAEGVIEAVTQGRRAVHEACAGGHLECVRALWMAGAEMEAPDADGFTPLRLAIESGARGVVAFLVDEVKVDVGRPDAFGETPDLGILQEGGPSSAR
ncbi:hypothetical protein HK101_004268 [Irineochytrium annulatum]|nr:hypothetical protein HK101_004268 [Irineochytrium annulatum]